jgi:hypothetical protein
MKHYFYDRDSNVVIAVTNGGRVSVLQPAAVPTNTTAADSLPDSALKKRKYTRRVGQKPAKTKRTGKRSIICKNCGGEGHQARTCKLSPTPTKEDERNIDKTVRLTELQFADAKEQFTDGVSTDLIRMSMPDVDLDEIRRAVKCETFEQYSNG